MVIGRYVAYQLSNKKGTKHQSLHELEILNIQREVFMPHINEVEVFDEEFSKVNDAAFSDEE